MFSLRAAYVPAFAPRRSIRSVVGLDAPASSSAIAQAAEACDCPQTVAVLTALGAERAAAMHEGDTKSRTIAEWIAAWRGHLGDEDERVIPLWRRIAEQLPGHARAELDRDIGQIVADHAVMERGFARGELPDPKFAARHAELEDRLIARYGARMLRLAHRGAGGGVRTTVGIDLLLAATMQPKAAAAPPYEAPVFLLNTDVAEEKFLDPRFDDPGCGASFAGYLKDIRRNASARIAAMRAKINSDGAHPSPTIKPFEQASTEAIRRLAIDLANKYTDPAQWSALAKQGGVDVSQIQAEATRITAILDMYAPGSTDLVDALYKQLGARMLTVVKDLASKAASLMDAGEGAASSAGSMLAVLGDAAAVLGPFVKAIADGYSAQIAERNKTFGVQCADYLQTQIVNVAENTQRAGLPPPLHVLEFDLSCAKPESLGGIVPGATKWVETEQQARAAKSYKDNFARLSALPITRQAPIVRWWALAVTLMSDVHVGPVFHALGNDPTGGTYASDEQVMLVAAPIAVAYGLDVDDFARLLWSRSPGWRDGNGPPNILKPEPIPHWHYNCPEKHVYDPTTWGAEGCDLVGDPSTCTTAPANAQAVQWSVLARDAFKLADDVKAGRVKGVGSLTPELQTQTSSGTGGMLVAGGLGLAAVVTILLLVLL